MLRKMAPIRIKRAARHNPLFGVSQMNGHGMQYGGYIVPFKGTNYQYGGYINPYFGSSYQYGTGVGFYRRQSGAGFLDIVKGIFRFLVPIVAPAAMHAGTSFMGNLTKGVDEGKSFKESAKDALKPALQTAIETGKERYLARQNKEGGRKRRRKLVYKGANKKRKTTIATTTGGRKRNHKEARFKTKKNRQLSAFLNRIKKYRKRGRGSKIKHKKSGRHPKINLNNF